MSKKRVKVNEPELGNGKVMPGPDEVGILGKEYLSGQGEEVHGR